VSSLEPVTIKADITCGCDLGNPMRQVKPEYEDWLHWPECAFWTPGKTIERPR
jgi:hypothetical protein